MDEFDAVVNKNLDSEEAIAAYLQGATKSHDEHYIHHCEATAAKAHAHLIELQEGSHQ